jgi:hypothetical protein
LVAERDGLPGHEPYWIREGFEGLQGWSALVPATTQYWTPVVRGATSRDSAFAAFVRHFQGR